MAQFHRTVLDRLGEQAAIDGARAVVDAASVRTRRGDMRVYPLSSGARTMLVTLRAGEVMTRQGTPLWEDTAPAIASEVGCVTLKSA